MARQGIQTSVEPTTLPRPMPRLATMIAILALGLAPAGAVAQSAGDEQYADPFATEAQVATPTPSPADEEPLSNEPPETLGSGNAEATPTPAPSSSAGGAEADDALPNTGSEPLVLAMLGTGLLFAGAGLRLRLQAD
jgi:LPXTG-motif cell wall-anchored protein